MHDIHQRQALIESLNKHVKRASSSVSTKVEAQKGDYKLTLSDKSIDQFYKDQHVGSVRVASLTEEQIDLINQNPHELAESMLETFAATFDVKTLEETSKKENGKAAKTAAHATQDEKTYQMITQKQLDEQKPDLHPRTDEWYKNITQKQIPEHNQRPGTYDEITQAQLAKTTTTFYNDPLEAGKRRDEDRTTVTEDQLESGTQEYSEFGESDRAETGVKFDGGVEKQTSMIGEKQLAELLKHHKWTEPLTITEGKEQLGKQDSEIGRLTAAVADQIIKEAMTILGKTVIAAGITPQNVASIVVKLVSDESKLPALADTISKYKNHDIRVIDSKIAKAQYFGKHANVTAKEWPELFIADMVLRQLGKLNYPPRWVAKSIVAMVNKPDLQSKIDEYSNEIIASSKSTSISKDGELEIFNSVLSESNDKPAVEGSAEEDGLYEYIGKTSEINENVKNREKFATAAAKFAKEKVIAIAGKENLQLEAQNLDVNEETGEFKIRFIDPSFTDNESLKTRAERRRELAKSANKSIEKSAQVPTGGMPPAAGPAMNNPAPPPGGADMNAPPPGEALSQEPTPEEEGLGTPGGTGEPKPPGSICPVDGSEDVDVDNGEFRCNSCGAQGEIHVNLQVKKWPDTIRETEAEGESEEGFGLGSEEESLGMEEAGGGGGTTMPNVPIGASVRLTPFLLEKVAKQNIRLGSVCPSCGGHNTDLSKSAKKGYHGICWDCMQEYNFQIKATPGKKNRVYAHFKWVPNVENELCSNCTRMKIAFLNSLKNYGMTWDEFNKLPMNGQASVVVKMSKAGSLDLSHAMKSGVSLRKYAASARWQGYDKFDKFPSASCIERLSRKFGENATAMSGPCQGKPLAKCVCSQLQALGIYTDGLAAKVASTLNNKDPMENAPTETCVQMLVRDNFSVKDACTACDGLKAAYATSEELLIETIAQINPAAKPMTGDSSALSAQPRPKPMGPASPAGLGNPGPGLANPPSMPTKPMDDAGGGGGGPTDDIIDDSPLDVPVSDELDDAQIGDDNFDDFDDFGFDMLDDNLDSGLEGGEVTIKLPADMAENLAPVIELLHDALQGIVPNDMIDDFGGEDNLGMGEDNLDVSNITDGTVDSNEGTEVPDLADEGILPPENGGETETEEDKNNEVPDLADENSDTEEKSDNDTNDIPGLSDKSDEDLIKETKDQPVAAESNQQMNKEASKNSADHLDKMLYRMKQGSIARQADALDYLIDGILKNTTAANDGIKKVERSSVKESKIKESPAQEASGIGKVKDGGKIGHEKPFTDSISTKPDIPRAAATIGGEGKEMTVDDEGNRPTVPHGAPLMAGEKHYKPEIGNTVDGNQGRQTVASTKTASMKTAVCHCPNDCKCKKDGECDGNCECKTAAKAKCNCGGERCSCGSGCTKCCKMCMHANRKENSMDKKSYTVRPTDKNYQKFAQKLNEGKNVVTLTDNKTYTMSLNAGNIVLAEQTVTPKKVKNLEDDPDLNPGSGPGAGKTHADKTHSLAVDEKKPSEGMSEPTVPEAPNAGRLAREHTVDNKLDGPTIPAGGGMNPDYDQNEKNKPEKMDQLLGKENNIAAMAEIRERATKIAGQMLKANRITLDELPNKIAELSNSTEGILNDYEKTLVEKTASVKKGLQKESSGVESDLPVPTSTRADDTQSNSKTLIQQMFTLDKRNRDFEKYVSPNDNRLWH